MATTTTRRTRMADFTLDLSALDDSSVAYDTNNWGFYITYAAFFFSGASAIAMWSSITLCLDFFSMQFPQERVAFIFPVINMSTLLIVSLYMVVAGRQLSLYARIYGSLAVYLGFIVLLPLANLVPIPNDVAYTLTVAALIGSTVCSSVVNSTAYGLGGVFGSFFIQAIDGGKAFGAMLLFLVRLMLKWSFDSKSDDDGDNAINEAMETNAKIAMGVFFSVAFVIVALTLGCYIAMRYTAFAQPLLEEYALVQHDTPLTTAAFSPLASPAKSPIKQRMAGSFASPSNERKRLLEQVVSDYTSNENSQDGWTTNGGRTTNTTTFIADDSEEEREEDEARLVVEHASTATVPNVLRTAAKPFFSLFLTYFICLSCFPGLISALQSTTFQLADWFPIVLVGCFNLGDLLGKNLPVYVMYFDVATLHRSWLLQLAFLPFFMVAMVHPFNDVVIFMAVVLLGITTGYVGTSSMILAPSVCSEYQKEVAGMIGGLCIVVGLCVGSYNGLAIETVLQLWLSTTSASPTASILPAS